MDVLRSTYASPQPIGKGRGAPQEPRVQPDTARAPATAVDGTPNATPAAAPAAAEAPQESVRAPLEAMRELLEQASRHIQAERRSISFEVREELGRAIVSVYDAETEELIRQIPSETLVRIATAMQELAQNSAASPSTTGLLLDERA